MLKINTHSLNVFNEQVERQFIQKIQRLMAEKYPHIFSRFPDQIQFKIVSNMMDRAKQWGINWKSSLVIFTELMKSPIDTAFEVKIPSGTQVYVGEVGSQGGAFVGGTQQIVVTKPWTIDVLKYLIRVHLNEQYK